MRRLWLITTKESAQHSIKHKHKSLLATTDYYNLAALAYVAYVDAIFNLLDVLASRLSGSLSRIEPSFSVT